MNPATSSSPCALVVDDEVAIRHAITLFLQSKGMATIAADNGRAALSLIRFQRVRPSLVISDLRMPEMGGLQLLSALRHDDPELPVLLISGFFNDRVKLMQILDHRTRFLQKPFNLRELGAAVDNLLAVQIPAGAEA